MLHTKKSVDEVPSVRKSLFVYCCLYLAYNIAVILGGAYVRATGSGAGCGAHWPLCQGSFVPSFPTLHTVIELSHRVSSGGVALGAIVLVVWAFVSTKSMQIPQKSWLRRWSLMVMACVILEALLGAVLVLGGLVASNSSVLRAGVMGLHLIMTFLLLLSLVFVTVYAAPYQFSRRFVSQKTQVWMASVLVLLGVVGVLGAVTALGDTIFRPAFVGQGLLAEWRAGDHILKSLRIYHPILAVLTSIYTIFVFYKVTPPASPCLQKRVLKIVVFAVLLQVAVGAANLALLAPIWAQILHLFFADFLWISAVLFWASVTLEPQSPVVSESFYSRP